MAKSVKFSNVQGGKTPYNYKLIPVGIQASDTFNNVPTGIFRGKVLDADNKTTLPVLVSVIDPDHVTDRAINWNKIPNFQLPAGLIAVWGWGSPRWANEAQPSDALNHGWTHSDNSVIDGAELVNAKRAKSLYLPYESFGAYFTALNEVKVNHPSVVFAQIVQEFTVYNTTASVLNFSYTNYLNQNVNASIPASQNGTEESMVVPCLFYTQPNADFRQGRVRIESPESVNDAAWIALGRAYYNQDKWIADGATGNLTAFVYSVLMFNEETLDNAHRSNQLLIKGMSLEAAAQGNPFKLFYYGKYFTHWGGGFYSGQQTTNVGWKLKLFPHLSTALKASAIVLNEYANRAELGEANCAYLNSASYFKVSYPAINSKYERQGNSYVLDQDGERKWRIGDFNETIRGMNVVFRQNNRHGFVFGVEADPSYGYPNNIVSEMFWAVTQFYAHLSYVIFLNIAIAKKYRGNEDVYTQFDNLPVKNCCIIRDETEAGPPGYSELVSPISTYQVEWGVLTSFALCESYMSWAVYNNQSHPNQNTVFPAVNKGSGHKNVRNIDGNNFQQFSQYEDMTWALKLIADTHAEHGVFGAGNKKIIAYEPANTTHEIQILGRVWSNKLWLIASEPRMDDFRYFPTEKIVVTVSNKKNNWTQKFNVLGGQNFVDTFVLPATDSYEPADIMFAYNDIYGVAHKVTGDLRQHLVSVIPPPPPPPNTETSLFEFFSPTNGDPYPSASPSVQGAIMQGNGYHAFQFAGWSIMASPAETTPTNIQAHVACKLFDVNDNLVCNIIDNRGNYHPNFAPFFPAGTNLRGNNHLPEFFKYLPEGTYKLWVKNTSTDTVTMNLRLGYQGDNGNGVELLGENLAKNAERNLTFNLALTPSTPYRSMVLNFNVYTYP